MISLREIQTIVREYPANVQPTRIESLGSAGGMSGAQFWRLETPRGPLALRRWPVEHPTPERLRFIHSVLTHAAERGIAFLPVPIRATNGNSFIQSAGNLWEFAPWMPGTADYEHSPTNEKLRASMMALARFHISVSDFPTSAAQTSTGNVPAISRHLARWNQLSRGGIRELSQSLTDAIWPELGAMARHFLSILPTCAARAVAGLESLANIRLSLQPCLRDIWHDHVLFSGDEVTGIIDFGALEIDTPATDIARLLGSLVGDDAAGWKQGVAAYTEVRPLSEEEECTAKALDSSGTILAGCNWLRWIYIDGRQFDNRAQVTERFRRIVARCDCFIRSGNS